MASWSQKRSCVKIQPLSDQVVQYVQSESKIKASHLGVQFQTMPYPGYQLARRGFFYFSYKAVASRSLVDFYLENFLPPISLWVAVVYGLRWEHAAGAGQEEQGAVSWQPSDSFGLMENCT